MLGVHADCQLDLAQHPRSERVCVDQALTAGATKNLSHKKKLMCWINEQC